jgi:hypothetical protein
VLQERYKSDVGCYHDVFAFDVSVDDVVLMAVSEGRGQLTCEGLSDLSKDNMVL